MLCGPKDEKRPGDVIGAAVMVARSPRENKLWVLSEFNPQCPS